MKYLGNIDLQGLGELQNATLHNLSTDPSSNLKEGRIYYNTVDKVPYVYAGMDAGSNPVWKSLVATAYSLPVATDSTLGGVIIGSNISVANDGTISVADASTSAKGVIEIATDEEVATGTSETLAVNPKQLATKITANTAITGATKCKITYDANGLVTAGADLADSDIPNLSLSKITDVTATAAEVNVLDGITASTTELNYVDGVTSSIQDQLNGKIGLTGLSIASGSTNYLGYDNTLGEFSAKVDTTVTASSTNLVTSGAVDTAIANFITASSEDTLTNKTFDANGTGNSISNLEVADFASGVVVTSVGGTGSDTAIPTEKAVRDAIKSAVASGVRYIGSIDLDQSGLSGLTVPAYKGDLYLVTGDSVTISGVEWNAGDYLIVNKDVASGSVTASDVEKIDNTESTDIVRLDATQTITNKTIDCATSGTGAGNNTITNLPFSALASGAVVNSTTGIAAVSSASDSKLPTEKAVASAIADFITASSTTTFTNKTFDANGTGNSISNLETADFASGTIVDSTTGIAAASSASDSKLPTEKAVATAIETAAANNAKVFSAQNGALTVSAGGQVTWTVTHGLGGDDVIARVYEVSSGEEVHCDVALGSTSGTVVIKLLAAADVAANTYKVVVVGGNYVAPQSSNDGGTSLAEA